MQFWKSLRSNFVAENKSLLFCRYFLRNFDFIILKTNANYCNKQVGRQAIYEVACWDVQYNKISLKAINKLTQYTVY